MSSSYNVCSNCATGWTIRRSKSDGGKIFASYPKRPDRFWSQTNLLFSGRLKLFPLGEKRLELEDGHLPPSSAGYKNEWSLPLLPPSICVHGVRGGTLCHSCQMKVMCCLSVCLSVRFSVCQCCLSVCQCCLSVCLCVSSFTVSLTGFQQK